MKHVVLFLGIILFLIGIVFNFNGLLNDSSIDIAMLSVDGLTSDHNVHTLDNTTDLLSFAYENQPDILVLNAFDFIEHYDVLFNYRAMATVPDHYSVLESSSKAYKTPKVAYSDKRIVEYYIDTNKLWQTYNLVRVESQSQIYDLLDEELVEYAVIRSTSNRDAQVETGLYDQLVLLNLNTLSTEAILETDELLNLYFNPFEFKTLDEDALNEVVRWLYDNGFIHTRYYFKDLVYSQDYWED